MTDERFVLDARVVRMLAKRAFVAELENGHRFTAFLAGRDPEPAERPAPGRRVKVEFSPCDLSKGRIVSAG